ncbi:GreA/GreB family elongation factor [Pseudonocardia sp. KRD291]|uniref:GreA/GreB family elongation factor n=1 Tax=Pseudonocardia sp. KRD291 TaxID=2792007 RepID=UPI001C4A0BB0|nr:GreA/GreB family elongation factor [Pseudonocardia sp. KRD291]MBW0101798.1 GreA/GreB family elongation factor [Pseudonocardia sp. KRD291]
MDSPVWLAQVTYDQLRNELAALLRQRAGASAASDPAGASARDSSDQHTEQQVLADRRDRDHRIRKLQELLRNPAVGDAPPDDGVAEPGMVLTVRYPQDPEPETFLLAHREGGAQPDVEICSPDSPLGRALTGAREGATCEYRLPDGRVQQVTLERAAPYRAAHQRISGSPT